MIVFIIVVILLILAFNWMVNLPDKQYRFKEDEISTHACYKQDEKTNVIAVKLPKGVSIRKSLEDIMKREGFRSASIHGIGAVEDPEIWYYKINDDKTGFVKKKFRGVYEIISSMGNLTYKDDKPSMHLHIGLSGHDSFNVFGGHLNDAKIGILGEFFITPMELKINRKQDKQFPSISEWNLGPCRMV